MVGLTDLVSRAEPVTIRGQVIEVKGVSVALITDLLANSDELKRLFAQKDIAANMIQNLLTFAPIAVAQVIAAATGKAGDLQTINFALQELTAGESTLLLEAVVKLTFPQGLKSFVDGLTTLAPVDVKRGWAQVTNSPPPFPSAFGMDIEQETVGSTPHDNSELTPS